MTNKTFRNPFNFLLFTSIYIAFVAMGMVHQTALLFYAKPPFAFYAFVLAGTLCSYNFHWFLTQSKEGTDVSFKTSWHIRYRHIHLAIALVALGLAAFLLVKLIDHWIWLSLSALFTFLYTAPKVPLAPFSWLKDIAYGKTVFLALAWMHVTTMLPLLMVHTEWQLPHYLFALNRFFLIYAICILFDLRDREQDRLEGIKSMITQLTAPQVRVIYYGILLFWTATTLWLSLYFSSGIIFSLFVPGLLLWIGYNWAKQQRSDYVYYFLLDGLMVISFPLMLLFQF